MDLLGISTGTSGAHRCSAVALKKTHIAMLMDPLGVLTGTLSLYFGLSLLLSYCLVHHSFTVLFSYLLIELLCPLDISGTLASNSDISIGVLWVRWSKPAPVPINDPSRKGGCRFLAGLVGWRVAGFATGHHAAGWGHPRLVSRARHHSHVRVRG